MAALMAVISKAVFDKMAPGANIGDVVTIDRYASSSKALAGLGEAGAKLFLVTVRPPDERLWLVAILSGLEHDGEAWVGRANKAPVTDIGSIKKKIKLASGVGITAKPGALGMSLQTPRALTDDDVKLLDGVVAKAPVKTVPAKKAPAKKATPVPPTTVAYRFANPARTTFAGVRKMSKVRQAQVLSTLQIRNGSAFATMDAAAKALPAEFATNESLALDRYDIIPEGQKKPAYEMWIYGEEHGVVFELGGPATPVHCVQRGFWSVDDDDEQAVALAEALDDIDWP